MTFVLGLTGGIATGKSTADAFFKSKKISIIDADQISHQIMNVGEAGYLAVQKEFGPAYFNKDQTLNRQKLGQLVFAQPMELKKLNNLLHPLIKKKIKQQIEVMKAKQVPLLILDVPLLFETGMENLCDQVLVISLPEKIELERLMKRNNLTLEEAASRIHSQMPLKEKEAQADYVVDNTGTIRELEDKLEKILIKIKAGV